MMIQQEREPVQRARPLLRLLAYGLYFVAVTALFISLRIPANALQEATERLLNERVPQFSWRLATVTLRFPATLVLAGVEVSAPTQDSPPVLTVDQLKLHPAFISALKGEYALDYQATLGQGRVSGSVSLPERSASVVALGGQFSDLLLSSGSQPLTVLGRELRGKVSGSFRYRGRSDRVQGEGEAAVELTDGGVSLAEPLFGLTRVDFSRAQLDLVLQGVDLAVKKVEFRSRDFAGEVSGAITLDRSLPQSQLQVAGWCELFPSFFVSLKLGDGVQDFLKKHSRDGKIPFMLHGVLAAPQFTLK